MPKLICVDNRNDDVDGLGSVLLKPIHKWLVAVIALEYRWLGLELVRTLAKHSPLVRLRRIFHSSAVRKSRPAAQPVQASDRQLGRQVDPIGVPHPPAFARC